eukprot:TRINITY_DN95015_c0_g1_i1.p1 TRINITY_DN95015_c0_g1~~TRINITY_DN95015_c0_g1_i1.p1  ORF type:complete len:519 (-),score=76.71 TRINITY_DN95015_c0_g1_i1:37-1566(-)
MQEALLVCASSPISATSLHAVRTDAQIQKFSDNVSHSVRGCAFVPRHNVLACVQQKTNQINLFHLAKEKPRQTCFLSEKAECLAAAPDGVWLAGGLARGSVVLWHVDSGEMVRILDAHYKAVTTLMFTPDGAFLVTGSEDCSLKVWNMAELLSGGGDLSPTPHCSISDNTMPLTALATCGHDHWVLVSSMDHTLRLIDCVRGRTLFERTLPSALHSVAATSLGRTAFAGAHNGTIYEVTIAQGARGGGISLGGASLMFDSGAPQSVAFTAMERHKAAVTQILVSADDLSLFSASDDGCVVVWDAASRQPLRTVAQHKGPITGLALLVVPADISQVTESRQVARLHPQVRPGVPETRLPSEVAALLGLTRGAGSNAAQPSNQAKGGKHAKYQRAVAQPEPEQTAPGKKVSSEKYLTLKEQVEKLQAEMAELKKQNKQLDEEVEYLSQRNAQTVVSTPAFSTAVSGKKAKRPRIEGPADVVVQSLATAATGSAPQPLRTAFAALMKPAAQR